MKLVSKRIIHHCLNLWSLMVLGWLVKYEIIYSYPLMFVLTGWSTRKQLFVVLMHSSCLSIISSYTGLQRHYVFLIGLGFVLNNMHQYYIHHRGAYANFYVLLVIRISNKFLCLFWSRWRSLSLRSKNAFQANLLACKLIGIPVSMFF